jgi:hypothetical protein
MFLAFRLFGACGVIFIFIYSIGTFLFCSHHCWWLIFTKPICLRLWQNCLLRVIFLFLHFNHFPLTAFMNIKKWFILIRLTFFAFFLSLCFLLAFYNIRKTLTRKEKVSLNCYLWFFDWRFFCLHFLWCHFLVLFFLCQSHLLPQL